jgi:hypothetical protein
MRTENISKETITIIIAVLILTVSYLYPGMADLERFLFIFGGFLLIVSANILTKRIVAYNLEANIKTRFWSLERFGFQERKHFKTPLYMLWLPPILSLISRGNLMWLPILEFEVTPRVERIAKRHELYRFAEMTEWHIGLIAFGGVLSTLALSIILNLFGLTELAKLSLYYSIWLLIPISSLDGTKLLFGNRKLWLIAGILTLLAFVWQSMLF